MPETAKTASKISSLHVLVVDDDDTFLLVLCQMLAALGIDQVTLAKNGSDAYAKLKKIDKVVDCILCDYIMKAGSGLQLLQAVRIGKIKVLRPDTCFILITVSSDPAVIKAAGQLDVSGYLMKPVTPQLLESAIVKARARIAPLDFAKYQYVSLPQP